MYGGGGGWNIYIVYMPPILTGFEYHGITEQIITIESCPDSYYVRPTSYQCWLDII